MLTNASSQIYYSFRKGISLAEALVVIAIIGIVISVLLPAVQAARESARKLQCQNNIRQLALACQMHEAVFHALPSDGWGWGWGPEEQRGVGVNQPGGWIYNILPFVEQTTLHGQASGVDDEARRIATGRVLARPLALFICPSRRKPASYPYTQHAFPLVNVEMPVQGGKTDYAINAGDYVVDSFQGPSDGRESSLQNYVWPDLSRITGLSFARSSFRLSDVLDGTSNTVLVGEKSLSPQLYTLGLSRGDDQSMFIGDDADIRRFTMSSPIRDPRGVDEIQLFGSAHSPGCFVAMCDGSVRLISYGIGVETFQALGNRSDGRIDSGLP